MAKSANSKLKMLKELVEYAKSADIHKFKVGDIEVEFRIDPSSLKIPFDFDRPAAVSDAKSNDMKELSDLIDEKLEESEDDLLFYSAE